MAGIARKVGSKDSRFLRFRLHTSLRSRVRALSAFIGPWSAEREVTEGFTRSLSPFVSLRGERRESRSFRRPFSSHGGRMGIRTRFLDNGKLEDLVRLALKRLNVSYLTILSRLVWFQRETLVCHERERKEIFATCHLEFRAIKFYSISLSYVCPLIIDEFV